MQPLNNLDVIILIITAISALIALCRGFVKEVLSIVGWVLAAIAVFYLLPVLTPLAQKYIASTMMASIVTALLILIIFYVVWLLSTDKMIGKVRTSKLSALDRMLGLLFGVLRACLLVILFNILMTWMLPEESESEFFADSRYFTYAGEFADPLKELIPQSTIDLIRDKSAEVGLGSKPEEDETEEKDSSADKEEITEEEKEKAEIDELFEKLAQPKIEKIETNKAEEDDKEEFVGYKEEETDNLDRLIETTVE